ncbi:hypothetical protein [Kutzneria sp. CA-103260]|uniref:hypothetical protein n=1 Tax=Kutzneria sp. CA-103260 TaxID=2802641 RepID=UPI001BAE406B|nr:hypothetical protein [Kutzneria sp. CA-103260]QUQ68207.1 hypothetical protein JJ691_59500 [Kutzneria sp. CA-103260]
MTEPCVVCGTERVSSPSDFFCSDQCQRDWHARRVNPLTSDVSTWLPSHANPNGGTWRAA